MTVGFSVPNIFSKIARMLLENFMTVVGFLKDLQKGKLFKPKFTFLLKHHYLFLCDNHVVLKSSPSRSIILTNQVGFSRKGKNHFLKHVHVVSSLPCTCTGTHKHQFYHT